MKKPPVKKIILVVMLVLFAFCAATAIAQDAAPAAPAAAGEKVPVDPGGTSADFIWLLVSAFLVFFMQAGFAMVETGFTRAKNATNILMKNLLDFSIGSLVFFFIGWGFMYGQDVLGVLGITDFAVTSADPGKAGGYYQYATWLFQVVFAATAATIVSGAMAERTKFKSYLIYSVVISAIIYPVTGHWIWNPNGWLAKLNFLDFAGSTVVHSVGGWLALTGAVVLGPRIGKYGPDGRPKAIAGHNIPLAALGVFILWLGWFGFNPGSTLKFADNIGHIAVTTNLSAAAGAVSALITIWIISKKPDASMALNGVLAGLVAVTAPCANVSPVSAVVIGLLAGVLVVLSVLFVDRVLKIDDPVGAISVHGVCGVFGTLAVGLFAEPQYNNGLTGLFFGGGFHQLGVQALGIASVAVYVLGLGFALFFILKKTVGLRVSKTEELKGLDIDEHGMEAYSGFQILD